jgi:signal transduction histidine kinase
MSGWPRSLVGRTTVILVAGVIISNLVVFALFFRERTDALTAARAGRIAEEVATVIERLETASPDARRSLVRSLHRPGLRLFWTPSPRVVSNGEDRQLTLLRDALEDVVPAARMADVRLAMLTPSPAAEESPGGAAGHHHGGAAVGGSVPLGDGSWLNLVAFLPSPPPFWGAPVFPALLATTALVLAVALWAVRRAARPWMVFARAAERLGLDIDSKPLPEEGPLEVQGAARAFNEMQARLTGLVRGRTRMLAAISHDLRTPITRLRLRAEFVEDDEERRKMLTDLDEMQAMIAATLAFARDDAAGEPPVLFDLAILLDTACEEWPEPDRVSYAGPAHASCRGRPSALKRAFVNLIDNAVRYGNSARVSLSVTDAGFRIQVDDDGPGIAENDRVAVFDPFYRGDSSRSADTGGVGLGLAVVRSVVERHGGRVTLTNRAGGGLRANVLLPVDAAAHSKAN